MWAPLRQGSYTRIFVYKDTGLNARQSEVLGGTRGALACVSAQVGLLLYEQKQFFTLLCASARFLDYLISKFLASTILRPFFSFRTKTFSI